MKILKTQSGFSLVETLVAITILLIVISGPLAISSSAAKSSSFSSEQVVAFFLAQEGIELVEKARDDLLLQHYRVPSTNADPWANFTSTTLAGRYRNCHTTINPSGCDFTISSTGTGILTLTNCAASATACLLYLEKTTASIRSRYTHTASLTTVTTPYTRVITFTLVNADELKVVSKVTWRTGAFKQQQEASVESTFFNVYGTK